VHQEKAVTHISLERAPNPKTGGEHNLLPSNPYAKLQL
jgi:hypothetical protein